VRCSALQCVAVRCSVLQCVAVCCSVLKCIDRHMFEALTKFLEIEPARIVVVQSSVDLADFSACDEQSMYKYICTFICINIHTVPESSLSN